MESIDCELFVDDTSRLLRKKTLSDKIFLTWPWPTKDTALYVTFS